MTVLKGVLSLLATVALLAGAVPARAQEVHAGPVQSPPAAEARVGRTTVSGDGDLSGDSQELMIRVEKRRLFDSPLLLFAQGKVGQERHRAFDLHRWGSEFGMGWELDPETSLQAGYKIGQHQHLQHQPRRRFGLPGCGRPQQCGSLWASADAG